MTNVSYRGNAPAMNDVIAGHLKTMFSNVSDALPHAASGSIRLLAVSTAKREAQAPDVPTVAESGFPGFNVVTWNGLVAPANTPREIVDKVAGEIGRAVKDTQFAGRLKAPPLFAAHSSCDEHNRSRSSCRYRGHNRPVGQCGGLPDLPAQLCRRHR